MLAPILLALSGCVAGIMNAVAGGGTFLTFPALIFTGIPSVAANASNTVALFPASFASAWAYRENFQEFPGISLRAMLGVSAVGGVIGAAALLLTPQQTFDGLIPWLLLAATLIFTLGPVITPRLKSVITLKATGVLAIQFLVAIYGGYFGGAMGIVMLAVYSLFGLTDLHAMNAAKTLMSGTINAVSVVLFVAAGKIAWRETLIILVTAVLGGYFGARLARHANPKHLRVAIIAISATVTAAFFLKH